MKENYYQYVSRNGDAKCKKSASGILNMHLAMYETFTIVVSVTEWLIKAPHLCISFINTQQISATEN